MAWAQGSATERTVMGNKRVTMGTFTQGSGDTGGTIVTGLKFVEFFECTNAKSVSNSAGTVTVVTADPGGNVAGYWMAMGY